VLLPCSGIFATHLHLLLVLLRNYPRVLPYKMAVRVREQQPHTKTGTLSLEPTMRLEPGECTESLALEVAEEQGIPGSILTKAMQYFETLQDMADDESLDPSRRALDEAAAGSVRFVDAASDSSGGTGSAAAAAAQSGSESDLPQQQQNEADAAGAGAAAASRRRRRRSSSSTRKSAAR
jgi:DNA mismatch repair ATPase MutS